MMRGEIYLVRLDPAEGSEQLGTRPCVIVSRNSINQFSPVIIICPITNAENVPRLYPSDVRVKSPEGGLLKDSIILTNQIRAIAKNRLIKCLGMLEGSTVQNINKALRITLDL